MVVKFNLPQYRAVFYALNEKTGYYLKKQEQVLKTPLISLPDELKLAATRSNAIKVNASRILHSREKSKNGVDKSFNSYSFLTGLQDTSFKGWFLGNDYRFVYGKKVRSIILARFSESNDHLIIYYFDGFDKRNTAQRLKWANEMIPILESM